MRIFYHIYTPIYTYSNVCMYSDINRYATCNVHTVLVTWICYILCVFLCIVYSFTFLFPTHTQLHQEANAIEKKKH